MNAKTLSVLMAVLMIGTGIVSLVAANARGADVFQNNQTRIYLNSNNYPGSIPGNWYYPGDSITGYLEGRPIGGGSPDGLEDILDVVVADDDGAGGCDAVVYADRRLEANNIALDPVTGMGTFSFQGSQTQYLSDGYYCAWVAPGDYLEGTSPNTYIRNVRFEIHEYRIQAWSDRGGYIPGNKVTIFYTVSRIKDGSPMTMTGYQSNWLVQATDFLTYAYGSLTQSAGKFNFTISNNGATTPPEAYPTMIWFNSTTGGATRRATWMTNVQVGNLACNIAVPGGGWTYAPGAVMEVDVNVDVSIPFGPSYDYPGAGVVVKLLDGGTPTSPEITAYTKTFTSDGSGAVMYAFVLDPAVFLDGRTYTVWANATSILKYASDWTTFNIRKSIETMSVRLTLDKTSYYSDENAVMTVAAQPPTGHSAPSTYLYSVTSTGGGVFARDISSLPTYTFHIPRDFQGTLTFRADVYNIEGDYGWDDEQRSVDFGVLIVNVNPGEYNAGDVLTVNFELKSTVMTGATTTFYYVVSDTSRVVMEGQATVASGALSGSFTFTVPSVPSTWYGFDVYASGGGHVIQGSATARLIQDFILSISFDKKAYSPGETMQVSYTISPRVSGTPLPRTFQLQFGLIGYTMLTHMTTESSGTVHYVVPDGANEGDTLFQMMDGSTGTMAIEVVIIGPGPAEIGGIELFDAFLLVLIVILFLLVLALRGRGAGAGETPKPKEEKAAPPPPPGQQVSPMIVNCKSCGAPIEITTSKRPIEVMCPSCGETAMVE